MKKSEIKTKIDELILAKETELELDGRLLKIHFQQAYESLKPINIIKNALKQVVSSPTIKTNILDSILGMVSGVVTKKVLVGKSNNPLSKILGTVVEMFVANKVTANADEIKSIGNAILKKIINTTGNHKED